MSLFAELKRRNVIRMAGLYMVGAWLILQVADTLLPVYEAPGWVMKVLVAVLAIGFIPALALAWIFELTQNGIKRDEDVAPQESIAPRTAQRMNRTIMVGMVLALGYFVIDKFVFTSPREAAPSAQAAASEVKKTNPTLIAKDAIEADAAVAKSIAVLPFENLSSDPDNAYFATGMQAEILTRLSKIDALKVISSTSTMQLPSNPTNLPEIASRLGVSAILEGSVQRSGNTVLVNVQLIRAATDEHLWAESYNRKLADVFGVQAEVAEAVALALNATLTGAERIAFAVQPTNNTEAYEFYLRGLASESRFTSGREDLEQRAAAYQKAVDLDPSFGLAWAGLASAQTNLYSSSARTPARLAAARRALSQAQRLAPDAGETWAALGAYRYFGAKDFEGAYQAFEKALESRPSNGLVLSMMGNVRRRQGHWQQALALQTRASEFDPVSTETWGTLGMTLRALRRYDDAQVAFDRGLGAVPGDPGLLGEKIVTYLQVGDLDTAERFVQSIPPELMLNRSVGSGIYALNSLRGRHADNIAGLKNILSQSPPDKWNLLDLAVLHSLLGGAEKLAGDHAAGNANLKIARDALESLRRQMDANPQQLASIATLDAAIGDRDAAYRLSDEAVRLAADDAYSLPMAIQSQAFVRMLGGDKAEAITLLRKAQVMPSVYGDTAAQMRIDPSYDPLRGEPGFDVLTRGNGLPLKIPSRAGSGSHPGQQGDRDQPPERKG